jgi:riboflavin biosynthesis pyrimidine reductase
MRALQVSANLIVGVDGATTRNGSSSGLSPDADRKRFHQLRQKSDLIIIGGNTARREPYKRTPIPLYILTYANVRLVPKNQLAKQFKMTPARLLDDIRLNFPENEHSGPIRVLVEAGPKLLQEMIDHSLIDYLYLTVNTQLSGENQIQIQTLIKGFKLISNEQIDGCEFRLYKKLSQ